MDQQIKEVRLLKALHNISYTAIAAELGVKQNSFFSWLRGQYQFSPKRSAQLQKIIDRYKEEYDGQNT